MQQQQRPRNNFGCLIWREAWSDTSDQGQPNVNDQSTQNRFSRFYSFQRY
jgi:hypothetical protein